LENIFFFCIFALLFYHLKKIKKLKKNTMKHNRTFIALLFVFCLCGSFSGTNNASAPILSAERVKQTIRDFSKALVAKDTALLGGTIAEHFSVSVATWPASRGYLQTMFDLETIDSLVPTDGKLTVQNSFKQRTEATIYVRGREPQKTNVTFDIREGKILYVDYLDGRYGLFRNRPSLLMGVLPFEQEKDLGKDAIIVTLKINNYDKPLRFLFDTGADGMAISQEMAEKVGAKISHQQSTSVVGGNRQIVVSGGNTVHLTDTLRIPNQNMAIFETISTGLDGILGLNLARNWIVKVNFDEKNIYLYSFGDYEYEAEGEIEHITTPRGIIHIPGFLNLTGDKIVDGNFVFDTGAEYYLMAFSPWVRRNRLLLSGFKPENQASTTSMGITTPTYEGKAHEFAFGETIRQTNMPVSLQASSPASSNWNPGVDGSVGIKLLSQYNFTINLVEKEVHFGLRK
jgi:predicted aspartyl protease